MGQGTVDHPEATSIGVINAKCCMIFKINGVNAMNMPIFVDIRAVNEGLNASSWWTIMAQMATSCWSKLVRTEAAKTHKIMQVGVVCVTNSALILSGAWNKGWHERPLKRFIVTRAQTARTGKTMPVSSVVEPRITCEV